MRKAIYFIFFAITSVANSQSLEKVVYDKENNQPVIFASVYTGNNKGVITNQEGVFKLNVANLKSTDSLYFSSLGFQEKALTLEAVQKRDTIFLKIQQEMLDEVVVSNDKLSANQIIQRLKDSLESNHTINPSNLRIFSRNKQTYKPLETGIELDRSSFMSKSKRKLFNQKVEDYFTSIQGKLSTSFRDDLYNAYYLKDSVGVEHIKSTLLINEQEDTSMDKIHKDIFKELFDVLDTKSTFKVRTGIIPVEDSLSTEDFVIKDDEKKKDTIKNKYRSNSYASIIDKSQNLQNLQFFEDSKKYDFTLENTSFFNGEIVYEVSFKPRRGSAKYKGIAYISAEDFGLLRLDYQLMDGEKEAGINLKFLLGIKFRVDQSSFQYLFRKNEDGKYYPYVYKSSANNYVYFSRSFVFKENNDNRDERIKFKLSLLVESESLFEEEYVILDAVEINPDEAIGFNEEGYIFLEKIDKYDPSIWEEYDVIQATQEIKDYK
jgi:hypothetical protein